MSRRFGSSPEDIVAAFGPGICGDCFGVSGEVLAAFSACFSREKLGEISRPKENGEYLLDLKKALTFLLLRKGVRPDCIHDTGICSYESENYVSYERDGPSKVSRQTLSGIVLL